MVVSTRVYAFLFLILLIANVGLYQSAFAPREMHTETFVVGKGSATLVKTENRKIILIGAGSDASILRELGTRLAPWEREIDLLVLRSTASKDAGGAPEVLKRYKVKVLTRPQTKGTYTWENALVAATSASVRIIYTKPGDTLSLDGIPVPLK